MAGLGLEFGRMLSVDADKNPEYLRHVAAALTEFRDRLEEFLSQHVATTEFGMPGRGLLPAVVPRDDADRAEVQRLFAAVSRAAGKAVDATRLTNGWITVQGAGAIDPIVNWETIRRPKPLLEASDVLGACDRTLGQLETKVARATAEAPPAIGAAAMHPLIWGAAQSLWRDQHFREAVAAAADALIDSVKRMTGRNDVSETALWQETFAERAPLPDKPRLRWPGDASHRDVKSMNDGLRQFAPGLQMTIRNPAVHGGAAQMSEQDALERLATLSLLARWVGHCQLVRVDGD